MKDSEFVTMYFDGAAEPNPGQGGCGFVVMRGENVLVEMSFPLGNYVTNNMAEHLGLYHGLAWLFTNGYTNSKIVIYGDSELVLKQIFGHWKCKAEHLKPLVMMSKALAEQFASIKADWISGAKNPADKFSRIFAGEIRQKRESIY